MIKIVDNRKEKLKIPFRELSYGEFFEHPIDRTTVFMKIMPRVPINNPKDYTAIDLGTGKLLKIGEDSRIHRLNVKLVIED